MKNLIYFILITLLFLGCSQKTKVISPLMPETALVKSDFSELPNWQSENYTEVLDSFVNNCQTNRTQKLYDSLCEDASQTIDAKSFLESNFIPLKVYTPESEDIGLLTGYYEPQLRGSLKKDDTYRYPVYMTPSDLLVVDLSSVYPELKSFRLRGKLVGNRVVPYEKRAQSNGSNSEVICYVDSKIDLFFLEIQGSGRITLDDGDTIFVGYDNQNGHKYRAIGRYLVEIGALEVQEVSLQSIRTWLDANPQRVDEVLNYNDSLVYFKQRSQAATGSLGLELTPERSIAVDRKYIPLGAMLYLNADINKAQVSKVVMAQDTGGAIKGAVRADMFLGYGKDAMEIAGRLKSPLELWVLLPKDKVRIDE